MRPAAAAKPVATVLKLGMPFTPLSLLVRRTSGTKSSSGSDTRVLPYTESASRANQPRSHGRAVPAHHAASADQQRRFTPKGRVRPAAVADRSENGCPEAATHEIG